MEYIFIMKKIILLLIVVIPLNVKAISASSYIVMDSDNNRVLEGSNINKKSLIASITKIMTSMVVIETSNVNKNITIGEEVLKSFGSGIYVSVGEKIGVLDLLYGLMLRSGNDAAIALAYHVAGSMDGFAFLMNNKAKDLGMNNTSFVNSSGLEDGDNANMSTVYDMALLSSYAINNSLYRKIVGTKDITVKTDLKTYVWHNKHKLVTGYYEYAIGGKTGFTKQARRTLVTSARKDDMELVVVTLKAGDDWNDHMNLFNYGFDNYQIKTIIEPGEIQVSNQTLSDKLYVEKMVNVIVKKDGSEKVTTNLSLYKKAKDNEVGVLQVLINGEIQQEIPVYKAITPKVESQSWFDKLMNWFTGAVSF